MNRRKFMNWAGAAALGLAAAGGAVYTGRRIGDAMLYSTPANAALRDFPEQMPGASRLEKYPNRGARYCLVHIRQAHTTGNDTEEQLAQIREVQEDVYSILSFLCDKKGLREVYVESEAGGVSLTQAMEDLESTNAELRKLLGEDSRQVDKDMAGKRILRGGAYKLRSEGKLKIKAAETLEGNMMPLFLGGKETKEGVKAITGKREDILLQLIDKDAPALAVTVYGGGHSWADNIEEWNSVKPEAKFSPIEITPKLSINTSRNV
jgi:hypothetical protein